MCVWFCVTVHRCEELCVWLCVDMRIVCGCVWMWAVVRNCVVLRGRACTSM